jgi:uncharacterized membrane-anchored protein
MKITLATRLLAAGAACLAALVGLVIAEGRARAAGAEVILPMQPVDPRALLTGHYVQLAFAHQLPVGARCPPLIQDQAMRGPFDRRPTPWLALQRSGDIHVLAGEYATKAEAQQHGEIVARGSARCDVIPVAPPDGEASAPLETAMVTLDLGVDRFHADQDEAEALEKILRDRESIDRMAAIVSIAPDGTARTKGVLVDGKRVELTWF